MMLHSLVERYQHFGGTCCFHLQGRRQRQHAPKKCQYPSTELHGLIVQKTIIQFSLPGEPKISHFHKILCHKFYYLHRHWDELLFMYTWTDCVLKTCYIPFCLSLVIGRCMAPALSGGRWYEWLCWMCSRTGLPSGKSQFWHITPIFLSDLPPKKHAQGAWLELEVGMRKSTLTVEILIMFSLQQTNQHMYLYSIFKHVLHLIFRWPKHINALRKEYWNKLIPWQMSKVHNVNIFEL
jgi:hypothetical protein